MNLQNDIEKLQQRIKELEVENQKLKTEQEKYQNLLETLPVGYYKSTSEGYFIDVNNAMVEMFGYESKEEIKKIYIPADLYFTEVERSEGLSYEEEYPEQAEIYRLKRKDGSEIWVEDYARYSSVQADKTVIHEGILIDVTKRKKAEELLKQSEEQYRLIADNTIDVIWMCDLDFKLFYVSPSIERTHGFKVDEYLKLPIEKTMPPHSLEYSYELLSKEMELEKSGADPNRIITHEIEEYKKDGSTVWVEISVKFLRDNEQNPIAILGVSREITDRKVAENLLKQSEEKYRIIAENTADVIWLSDLEHNVSYVSPSVLKTYGYSVEEYKNLPIEKMMPAHSLKIVNDILENQFLLENEGQADPNRIITIELEEFTKDGKILWVETKIKLLRDCNNNINAFLGISRDISERKKAEELIKIREHQLAEVNKMLQTILDTIPIQIFWKDLDLVYRGCNKAFLKETGLNSLSDIVGKTDNDMYWKDIAHQFQKEDLEIIQNNTPKLNFEERYFNVHNKEVWALINKVPMYDSLNKIIGVIGTYQDISSFKKAEHKIIEQSKKLNTILHTIPDMLLVVDKDGYCKEAYATHNAHLSETPEQLIGKHITYYYNAEIANKSLNVFNYCLETGEMQILDYKLNINGKDYYFDARISKMDNEHVLLIVRDITEKKLSEDNLKENERKYRDLINGMHEGLLVVDNNDVILFVNPSFCKITGYELSELMGKVGHKFLVEEKYWESILNKNNDREKGLSEQYEIEMLKKNGEKIWFLMNASPVADANGTIIGSMSTCLDITERKQAEDEIKKLLNQVTESRDMIESNLFQKNELIEELENTKQFLEESNAEKDKFFSILAHDLKGPFSGFLSLTKILSDTIQDLSDEEIKQFADILKESAANLYQLLENLLEWSRLKRGITPFEPENIIIRDIFTKAIDLHKTNIEAKEIILENNINKELTIVADVNMLYAIIRNLISNAIKFTPRGGAISCAAYINIEGETMVSVKDSGIGMSEKLIPLLFKIGEHTFRPGTEDEPSTGLGLLLCKEYIDKHNAKIEVKSEINKGSEFIIKFKAS